MCQSVLPQAADRWKLKQSGEGGREGGRRRSGRMGQPWMGAKASSPCSFKLGRLEGRGQ